ncbi:uncharacterized protein LOC128863106 [Anastrepha ludens]|uniref:uncharacterized protein LOC128863106 n=1 Tax=Anastrepha ludens TaxID=28586 RepID=UPI0023B163DB|nr:uncharacterized protein LOC128863106 [Anastrepha ludens]XP_053958026.1 uncharacterized protein LOC128863106 [Anastrepha ludens]XP_053958027.1 uncharacterized protein LOC128863106 [Anastrepha ludens]XP_053958028.1 uncharacterized protein LOC128863106 [Anastrepha ludens]XP_053958029.1 uncharacterized protein LOC128863106 [Anastrepha ludens]
MMRTVTASPHINSQRLQAIRQLNIYFTLLRVYCMLVLNYFTPRIIRNDAPSSSVKVTYTPHCTNRRRRRRSSSCSCSSITSDSHRCSRCRCRSNSAVKSNINAKVNSNEFVFVKAINSRSWSRSRFGRQSTSNCQYKNNSKYMKENKSKQRKVLALLLACRQHLLFDIAYIKWLLFEHFANHFINMQIGTTLFATKTTITTAAKTAAKSKTIEAATTTTTTNKTTATILTFTSITCTNTTAKANTNANTTSSSAIKSYSRTRKRRRRGISTSRYSSWCSSGGDNVHFSQLALTLTKPQFIRLQGICIIRLISLKRFLQIPKQQSNIFLKRIKNCLSAFIPAVSCRSATIRDAHVKTPTASSTAETTAATTKTAPPTTAIKGAVPALATATATKARIAKVFELSPQPHMSTSLPALLQQPLQPLQAQLELSPPPPPPPQPQPQLMHQLRLQQQQLKFCCGFLYRRVLVLVKCLYQRARLTDYFGGRWHWRCRPLPLLHRTLTVLILLSSLWHGTECFHGSVKLSANTVKTKYGLLRGIVVRSSPLVEAYLGIPYASPPVGSLRFMPPITPSTWKNVRNADRFSPVCPQTVPIPPNGPEALLEVPRARLAQLRRLLPLLSNQSEDCLYLNIYVPYENRRKRRSTNSMEHTHDPPTSLLAAVLLIHGESYEWNSGNPYDGSELAAHGNIIVVTINFRLGIFGFLKTGGKESAQGNFGLMDLVAGLHWLKENLPAFGGDPQRITLLGHSTGAALANILMVSPVASDLVQRAALVSGSALSPWAIQKNPLFVKRRVAEQTGCHGDMLYDDLAPCLRTKSIAELLAVKIDHPRFLSGFAPFIDGTVISPNVDPVGELTLPLGSAIVSTSGIEFANFPKRDLIFCLTSVESYLDLSAQDLEFGFNETRRDRILRTFVRNNFHYHLNEIFAVLKNEYTDWEKAIRSPLSSRDATLSFLSDGHTAAALIKLGYMHSLRGGRSYFLHFKHRTVEEEYPQRTGSVRGEDVPFWLGLPISPLFPHNYTTQEKQISRLMLHYLANFAKTGNPNHSGLDIPSITASTSRSPAYIAQLIEQGKVKRASLKSLNAVNKFFNLTTPHLIALQQGSLMDAHGSLNLALFYNQRRSGAMRERRAYYKRHLRNNNNNNDESNEMLNAAIRFGTDEPTRGEHLPFWDAYDVVNQLYLELGNKAEVQSHYRGHKLSMWLNLIPQLHKHSNINDQSMRHHQFPEDVSNRDLYEGVVRPQIQTKPPDDEDKIVVRTPKSTAPTMVVNNNTKTGGNALAGTVTTECNPDGTVYVNVGDNPTTQQPVASDNRSMVEGGTQQKDLATASTGIIGNLEMFRRLSGKQFPSYTTALIATVAVGCFLLTLNILIFAGIYHQREKRARDAKTKEELQDNDTSKNSSILKLNAIADDDGSVHFDDLTGKGTVIFGEYNYYDEKPKPGKEEKLLVDLPPIQTTAHMELNWPAGSTSTLDLLKTKHHHHNTLDVPTYSGASKETNDMQQHLQAISSVEMATYNAQMPIAPSIAVLESAMIAPGRRSSFAAGGSQTSMQFDYAVQSSDQLSFKEIEDAVKASTDDIINDMDDDIPEPPPPPRSFQSAHHQLQQQQQLQQGGILRSSGSNTVSSTSGKKRVHIQEISV